MKDDLLGGDERPYGCGMCAVPECSTPVPLNVLTCGSHWRRMHVDHRNAVQRAWRQWQTDRCTLGELRDAQRAAVESIK